MDNKTLDYYNQNADAFVAGTVSVDFKHTQDKFLCRLNPGDYVLDFGCGSGRDTKYFIEAGIKVDAIDGSEELCRIASEYTGIKVKKMLFQELNVHEKYDGIWACSSILHLPKEELKPVFKKMILALKKHGVIYTSFKYGVFEGERNGRYFTDCTIDTFQKFLQDVDNLQIEDYWITGDVRPGRGEENGMTVILDTLHGSRNEKVVRYKMTENSYYGAAADVSMERLRQIGKYLLTKGYMEQTDDGYFVLKLTESSYDVTVKGEQIIIDSPIFFTYH